MSSSKPQHISFVHEYLKEDYDNLIKLDNENGIDDERLEIPDVSSVLVIRNNNKAVGHMVYYNIGEESRYIDWICAPGFGKLLMTEFERISKEKNVLIINLTCSLCDSQPSSQTLRRLNFYYHMGFKSQVIEYVNNDEWNGVSILFTKEL